MFALRKFTGKYLAFVKTVTNIQVTHSAEELFLSNKALGSQE